MLQSIYLTPFVRILSQIHNVVFCTAICTVMCIAYCIVSIGSCTVMCVFYCIVMYIGSCIVMWIFCCRFMSNVSPGLGETIFYSSLNTLDII